MDDANPRAMIGGNRAPLDQPDELKPRLERDHAELIAAIAQAELERFALPEEPATDEECAQLTEFVVKLKGLAKRLEDQRTAEGRPYLDGQRVVNAFFGAFSADLDKQTDARTGELTKRIGAYARAKAAREQAERIEKERLQREEARRLEQEAEDKRKAAEESQRQADEAAAKIRAAETPKPARRPSRRCGRPRPTRTSCATRPRRFPALPRRPTAAPTPRAGPRTPTSASSRGSRPPAPRPA
jgi:hypothetical protein